jgi:superfamily II DNA helicase RecQ
LYGNITVDNQGNFIRSYNWNGKYIKEGIYSPITQNQRHLEILHKIRKSQRSYMATKIIEDLTFNDFFKSVVVLANPKTVLNVKYAKKEVKNKIIRVDQLNRYIKEIYNESKEAKNSDKRLKAWADSILSYHTQEESGYITKYVELLSKVKEDSFQYSINQENYKIEESNNDPEKLIKELKEYRLKKSRTEQCQAYIIFNNRQMDDLVNQMPRSIPELLKIYGFGPVKSEKYGEDIIKILGKYI